MVGIFLGYYGARYDFWNNYNNRLHVITIKKPTCLFTILFLFSLVVTYFVTYGTAVACYGYFVLTKQEYLYPDARDRQYLINFHKKAKKHDWDVGKYNQLKEGIVKVEDELKRLTDPLRLKLPIEKLEGAKNSGGGVLGSQVNIGSIKDMLKGKFGSS